MKVKFFILFVMKEIENLSLYTFFSGKLPRYSPFINSDKCLFPTRFPVHIPILTFTTLTESNLSLLLE